MTALAALLNEDQAAQLAALAAGLLTQPSPPPPAPATAAVCGACGQRLPPPAVVFRAPEGHGRAEAPR